MELTAEAHHLLKVGPVAAGLPLLGGLLTFSFVQMEKFDEEVL